jgi:hypothetical protein
MKNPYFDEAKDFIYPSNNPFIDFASIRQKRLELVRKYSWSIPNEEAILEIIKYSPIIECGAGTGYWASLIANMGGNIVAYDAYPIHLGANKYGHTNQYYEVREGSNEKLCEYINHTLMLSWCPYDNDMGYDHISSYSGRSLILIGEDRGGCCGNDKMFDLLDKQFNLFKRIKLPCWDGIHDSLMIFHRKEI